MADPTSDLKDRVYQRIEAAAPKGVWSRNDFLDLGTQFAIEKALQRLSTAKLIRRSHRGLYDKPGHSRLTGDLVFPPRSSFVDAIARRDKLKILVDGMTAANDLGLTTAVPAHSTIHANTYPRTIEIHANAGDAPGKPPVVYRLVFKRISASTEFWAGRPGMRVVQALAWYRHQASENVDALVNGTVHALARDPTGVDAARDLIDNLAAMPSWMHPIVRRIASRVCAEHRSEPAEHAEDDETQPAPEFKP